MSFGGFCFSANVSAVAVILSLFSLPAAAGGLMLWEIGTPTLGTASAGWAATPEDAATAFTNPAGTVWREHTEVRAAGQALYGDIGFSNGGLTNVPGNDGGNPIQWFPGGGGYAAGRLSDKFGWGVALAGNFGLGLDYDEDWAGRRFAQEVDLIGLSLIPSLSWKVHPCLSVGAGLNIMGVYFKYLSAPRAGLIPEDAKLKYRDVEISYGGNLGIMYRPVSGTTLGLSYTSEVEVDFTDRLTLDNFGPFFQPLAERFNGAKTEIDITIPATATVSLQQKLTASTTLYSNLAWQGWTEYAGVTLAIDSPEQITIRVNRGYRDTGHFALGIRHAIASGYLKGWSVSTGFAYDSSMSTKAQVTADTPTWKAWRFGVGAGKEVCPGIHLDVGYTLVWSGDIDIDQIGREPFSPRLEGSYKNTALHFLGASVQFQF
ncbi:outer membrane protein transport protein [Microbulbifer thermotolerans]|uniref:OmpP1/FadL family transporter n=1 Tax=Microbulbifer thermotolerans TaxID=252514 RepID=UPI00224AFEBA|nr:outer membrane protein transport protein [Microbulbifer thermotolerans]MCX2842844.1 outer membrane protein transport protein [Microbulbifer thermotolerans]